MSEKISRKDFINVVSAYAGGVVLAACSAPEDSGTATSTKESTKTPIPSPTNTLRPTATRTNTPTPDARATYEADPIARECIIPVKNGEYDKGLQFLTVITENGRPLKNPKTGAVGHHLGWDIHAELGEPVLNACDGKFVWSGYVASGQPKKGSLGNVVIIENTFEIDGIVQKVYTRYGHLEEPLTGYTYGDFIPMGTVIGGVGSTGGWTTKHLHFDMMREAFVQIILNTWTANGNWEWVARMYTAESEFAPERIAKDMVNPKTTIYDRLQK